MLVCVEGLGLALWDFVSDSGLYYEWVIEEWHWQGRRLPGFKKQCCHFHVVALLVMNFWKLSLLQVAWINDSTGSWYHSVVKKISLMNQTSLVYMTCFS